MTFDDGPGPQTRELGRYLYDNCVPATFFVIGQAAAEQLDLLRQLRDWGHTIGNHTWSHPGLVDLALAGGDVVAEVARADALIRDLESPPYLLRPPYGSWQSESEGVHVAQLLRDSGLFNDYVGPIMWDIVGEDWVYWEQGRSIQQCLHRHVDEIEGIGKGILLLHDSSENPDLRAENRAFELMTQLVPVLRSRGFQFATVKDAVAEYLSQQLLPAAAQ